MQLLENPAVCHLLYHCNDFTSHKKKHRHPTEFTVMKSMMRNWNHTWKTPNTKHKTPPHVFYFSLFICSCFVCTIRLGSRMCGRPIEVPLSSTRLNKTKQKTVHHRNECQQSTHNYKINCLFTLLSSQTRHSQETWAAFKVTCLCLSQTWIWMCDVHI